MECSAPNCTWSTPEALPNYDLVMRSLESHNSVAHQQLAPQGGIPAPREAMPRPKDLPRPELEEDCTESDWNHFQVKWQRYRRSALSNTSSQHIIDQLWACCSTSLEETIWRAGAAGSDPTEDDLLRTMKRMAVKR